jgi:uncharacterized alpha-E superfamily protein
MPVLARVADSLYWAARYVERAEDTARIVRSYTEAVVDLPRSLATSWAPLLAIAGTPTSGIDGEAAIVRHLVADVATPASIAATVIAARENLRTTREVLPRDAWRALNDLYLYVLGNIDDGIDRRSRSRVLSAIVDTSRRLDGVVDSCMSHDAAYHLWRLGRTIERADMTTRVLGVRAAALLADRDRTDFDGVLWMSVLRSLSALQMYQRSSRRPIDGSAVVSFLLFDEHFPRSVRRCLIQMREQLAALPSGHAVLAAVNDVDDALRAATVSGPGGAELDAAMDAVQLALVALSDRVTARYLRPSDHLVDR